jgi:hypothetical protein
MVVSWHFLEEVRKTTKTLRLQHTAMGRMLLHLHDIPVNRKLTILIQYEKRTTNWQAYRHNILKVQMLHAANKRDDVTEFFFFGLL